MKMSNLLLFTVGLLLQCVVSVDITVSSEPWVDTSQDVTLTCSFSARLLDLTWRKGIEFDSSLAIVFYDTSQSPSVIWNDSVDQSHYAFDETSDSFPLTIKSVTLEDEDRYWCQVTEDGTFLTFRNSSDIAIREVTVTLQSEDSYKGDRTTLSCSYTILDNTYMVYQLEWFKGESVSDPSTSLKIAEFFQAATSPIYSNGYDDLSRYNISRDIDKSISTFDIFNVEFSRDRGWYLCRVTVVLPDGTNIKDEVASTDLIVYSITSEVDVVIISSGSWVDSGTDSTLTCTSSSSGTLRRVQWKKGSSGGSFDDSDAILLYTINQPVVWSNSVDPNHYAFDQTLSGVPLTIKLVSLDDEDLYWCRLNTAGVGNETGTAVMRVRVPPNAVAISYLDTLYSSDPTPVSVVAGSDHQFTCKANGIKPEVIFTWTYDSSMLQGTPQESTTNTNDPRLFDSSNVLTIDIPEIPGEQPLKCGATNRQDESTDAQVEINLMLQVKVPPKDYSVSLSCSGNDLDPGVTISVNQGEEQTLICTVQDTRPAATIDLYRNGTLEETDDQIPEGDRLVDTMEDFVFTPNRDFHKQLVECVAKTNESMMPYPYVSVTLDVDGPPDTPVISGSMTMTENVATTLTCTADLGYPDDWNLEWSNDGTAIGNPSDTTAALSGTSQRYIFTSQLEFTPNRQDNTHNIQCTAKKNSWTSTPLPEQTWGPINVQYETSITNKDTSYVRIRSGLTANLSCVAKGNPAPVITWFDPNNTEITNGGDDSKYMVEVSYTTFDSDMTSGHVTISKLTIQAVDAEVDYGVYTCNSTNDIGYPDSREIILEGIRGPNKPTGVVMTGRTSSSIAVRWTAGDDGGETQWFHVSHNKTADSLETFSDMIEEEMTAYNVTGLESYTEYEIRVYAENDVDRNPNPGSIVEYTLPVAPTSDMDFSLLYNAIEGTLIIEGLNAHGGCIQLEVKYEGIADWKTCGDCITTDGKVKLSFWCLQTRKRRRRAVGDVEVVRARLCQINVDVQLCSGPIEAMEVTDAPASSSTGVIVGVSIGVISLAVIVFSLGMFFGRKFKNKNGPEQVNSTLQRKQRNREYKRKESESTSVYQEVQEMTIVDSPNPDQSANTAYTNVISKDNAFPRDMLTIVKELGHGAFGQVFLAEANGIIERSKVTLVAVKTLKEGAGTIDKKDMMQELDLMQKIPDHCNVVKLLGYSVEQDPPYIIVEYLSRGNLKDLLKDSRSKGGRVYGNLHGVSKSLTSRDLLKFANDAADGMHFISSQKCIHRDLATRNILVAEDMTCKVSDFGLARDVIDNRAYERQSQGRLPLRWMALESVLDDVYTTESDVWSFGVLLWEIVTLGSRPYPSMSAKTMIDELQQGYRMPKPNQCQEELYQMMLKCWTEDPKSRPNFKEIGDELCKLGRQGKELISIRAYEEMTYEVTIPMSDQEKV